MRRLILAVCISSVLWFVACGGGSNNGGATGGGGGNSNSTITSVTATCSPNSVLSGLTATCSATVTGTGSYSSAVTWSASAGTITQAGAYTAPSVTATTQVTITATSAFDSTKSGSTTIAVTAPSPILFIQVSCSPNPIGTGEQTQCTAAVIGVNSDFQSVTWSATQAGYPYPLTNLPCNCISPTGVVTGPQVLGAGFVNVQATSVLDPTKVGNYTVYVHSPGTITSVTPSCTKSTLSPGQDTACTAVVTGSGGYSSAVEWRGSPESVSPSGLYVPQRAYNNGNTYVETITALSVQDQTVSGTFAVNVTPSTTTANNVVPVVVDGGPNAATSPYINGAFTSVTVCVPGTSNCQTIDHILVDTGSVGLRLLAAGPAGGELTLPLPAYISQSDGTNLVECAPFVSGYLWGPVVTADVLTLPDGTGEQASNIEMQIVGQPGQPAVPSTCISSGVGIGTLPVLGANGILGIGPFADDCGQWCFDSFNLPYIYYTCSASGCATTNAFFQVSNPVSAFVSDYLGTVLQLPTPATNGPLQGSLIFGINSQPNNQLGSATLLAGDPNGDITTNYQNVDYPGSFLDSGSNGFFFLNSQTLGTQMPACSDKSEWYCPLASQNFSVINKGVSLTTAPATFSVGNADQLFGTPGNYAIPTLGGNWPLSPLVFDFGLPFFYGRSIYTMIGGAGAPSQNGPGVAY
ncbi:MAG TPA: DUF3443 family protein [Terriglobales bacterium]